MAVVNKINQQGFVTELVGEGTDLILDVSGELIGNKSSVTLLTASSTLSDKSNKIYLANASSGNITLNLPNIISIDGFKLTVKKTDTTNNQVKMVSLGSQLIDGDSIKIINEPYTAVTLVSNNGRWWII